MPNPTQDINSKYPNSVRSVNYSIFVTHNVILQIGMQDQITHLCSTSEMRSNIVLLWPCLRAADLYKEKEMHSKDFGEEEEVHICKHS